MVYIQKVSSLPNYCLEIEMVNGSSATVNFKPRLRSAKYMVLKDEEIFNMVSTDGNYIIWQNGLVKITAKEVLGVFLSGGD